MIGQKKLLEKLNTYNIDNFPRSVMLLGEAGCGKHELLNYIQNNILKISMLDITENISADYIDKIMLNPNPRIYVIDLSKITEKDENVLLKFIEEPLKTSFIILLAESRNGILNTILNRCILFEFEQYSRDELRSFIKDKDTEELVLNIVRTPGKIKSLDVNILSKIYDTCVSIATRLTSASYANTLTIVNKINYKDESDKYDINIFFDTLVYVLFKTYLNNSDIRVYNMYIYTIEQRKKLIDKRLNKELFMTNFISNLWKVVRKND